MPNIESLTVESVSVNRAFSKQSINYDVYDRQNQILQEMRKQVYAHVSHFIKNKSHILELNAGTGIDAFHFVSEGHTVHATDLSDGMVAQIEKKISINALQNKLSCQQLSYDQLALLSKQRFDYVFSNFGGLNCIDDLSKVTKDLSKVLNPNAFVTWVIMPPVCPWELMWILKGQIKQATRRLHKNGVITHLEGEYFKTYYHSLSRVKDAFGPDFKFIKAEGLCALSPPPASLDFSIKHPLLYRTLRKIDATARLSFPFNRWADHLIVTFQYKP